MKAEPEPDEMQVDVEEAPTEVAKAPRPAHAKKPRGSLAVHAPAELKEWEQRFNDLSAEVMVGEKTKAEDGECWSLRVSRWSLLTRPHFIGTLVWAQMKTYPYYPAELVDPKDKDTPQWLVEAQTKNDVNKLPVLFFDDARSGWVCCAGTRIPVPRPQGCADSAANSTGAG